MTKIILGIGLIAFAAVFPSEAAHAQNRFFQDGANGFTVQAGIVGAESVSGFGGAANLTFLGRFDLGLAYTAPESKTGVGYIYKWKEYTPRLGLSLLRPGAQRPFGVDLVASYTSMRFAGTMNSRVGGDARAVGADIYFKRQGSGRSAMFYTVGLGYARAHAWNKDDLGVTYRDNTAESVMVGLELAFLIQQSFMITPSLTFFDGDTAWSVMLGFALPMER